MAPREVLENLLRIGKRAIVSFPNFGYWRVRASLAVRGGSPRTRSLPHEWYDTPNIHFCTIRDFVRLCNNLDINIEKSLAINSRRWGSAIGSRTFAANLMGEQALFLLKRNSDWVIFYFLRTWYGGIDFSARRCAYSCPSVNLLACLYRYNSP